MKFDSYKIRKLKFIEIFKKQHCKFLSTGNGIREKKEDLFSREGFPGGREHNDQHNKQHPGLIGGRTGHFYRLRSLPLVQVRGSGCPDNHAQKGETPRSHSPQCWLKIFTLFQI